MTNLKTNPNRDATASIRGYVYQIYQSLFAWVNLSEDETLILEGAEDFDVYRPDKSVTTTQIKDVSSNLTLRSSSIIESLNNFWDHCENNPDYNVIFRFLTPAVAGKEQGDFFESNEKGLEFWSKAKRNDIDIEPLRSFLLTLNLNSNLKAFIEAATDEKLRDKLVKKIDWDLGDKPKGALEDSINSKLKVHGLNVGLNTLHSCKALAPLLKYVADFLSTKGKKELNFEGFLDAFDKATLATVPQGELDLLRSSILSKFDHSATGLSKIQVFGEPIPLVDGYIPRTNIVSDLVKVLQDQKVIFLHGSSGLGKTNLAYLLSNNIGGNWAWAGLRGRNSEQIQGILEQANLEIYNNQLIPFVVIDDIKLKTVSSFERELVSLIFSVVSLKGMIIITSQDKPPLQLLPKIWKTNEVIISVPYFDETETEDMARSHGLENEKEIQQWGKTILLTTSGHPQLVHARVRTLSLKGWPKISASDLIKPDDVEVIRSEARNKLVEEFPNDFTRILAYRLSMVLGSFSREIAKAVAEVEPLVQLPGETFDNLVGPWIERTSSNSYKVSPLLNGAANNILSDKEINSVHIAIANSSLSKKSFDQKELGTIFFHAYLGKVSTVLLRLSYGLISTDEKDLIHLDNAIPWFSLIGFGHEEKIYNGDVTLDLLLRLIQYRIIASTENREKINSVIDKIESSLSEQDDKQNMLEIMAYGLILNMTTSGISSIKVISILSRLIDILNQNPHNELINEALSNIKEDTGKAFSSVPQLFFYFSALKIIDVDDLHDLIVSLDGLTKEKRNHLLDASNYDKDFVSLLISQGWLNESKNSNLFDTDKAIKTLNFAADKSREWNRHEITVACLVYISVLYDEYDDSSDKALAILDKADLEFPDNIYLMHQRAKVFFRAEQVDKALPLYEKVLQEEKLPEVDVAFSYRNVGVAEGDKGNWIKAEKAFLRGKKVIESLNTQSNMGIGFLADIAFSLWKQEEYRKSLLCFVEVLNLLESVPISSELYVRHLHATVRHIAGWIYFDSRKEQSSDLATPKAGMCSNQNPHKEMKNHKVTDISSVWHLLLSTEMALGLDVGMEKLIPDKYVESNIISVEATKRFSVLEKTLLELETDNLIQNIVSLHEVIFYIDNNESDSEDSLYKAVKIPKLTKEYFGRGSSWESFYVPMLISCLFLLNDDNNDFPVEQWETDLEKYGNIPEEVKKFLGVLNGTNIAEMSLYHQAALSVFLLKKEIILPNELWMICFRLFNVFNHSKPIVEIPWNNLIIKRWFFAANSQRFSFVTPPLICPEIEKMCLDRGITGLPKIAKILLFSARYLKINLADSGKEALKKAINES